MMRTTTRTLGILAAALLLVPTAGAQQESKPMSFDELLKRVQSGWRAERRENNEREAEFKKKKSEQKTLLQNAIAERQREEKRSEELEDRFQEGEVEVAQLEDQLTERLGNLGELFGVVRQVAGDTRGHLESSLVSAQYAGRGGALGELAESKTLPSIDQLEGLWATLLQEMVESGRVTKFPATVIETGGGEATRDVTRVGVFNAVSAGKYLAWNSEVGKLSELDRQPPASILGSVGGLESASDGVARFFVDPSRGSILSLLIQTPSVRERIEFGGAVGYTIIGLGAVTVLLALWRLVVLFITGRKVAAQKKSGQANEGNPLGRVLKVYEDNRAVDAETLELKLDEAVLRESSSLERFLWLIKVAAGVAPLMGLLGTVTGMIRTFQAIMLFGTGDPKMMAGGISEALVTTMLGLYAAIPLVLLHSIVSSMARRTTEVLDEQSAGLIARQAEQEHGDAAA